MKNRSQEPEVRSPKPRLTLRSLAEQTDARFEELTVSLDELTRMTNKKTLSNITRDTYLFILVMLLFFFCIVCFLAPMSRNGFIGTKAVTQKTLTMNQTEYKLLQSAVSLVQDDLDDYNNVAAALRAFRAELPNTIRNEVIENLGTVKNIADLPDAIESMLGRVIVVGGSPQAVQESESRLESRETPTRNTNFRRR